MKKIKGISLRKFVSLKLTFLISWLSIVPISAYYKKNEILELHDTLSNSEDSKGDYISMVSDYLEKSNFNASEQEYVKRWFTEFLNSYYDQMGDESLLNILWALDKVAYHEFVHVARSLNWNDIFMNAELAAAMISNESYDKLKAIMEMMGDRGLLLIA